MMVGIFLYGELYSRIRPFANLTGMGRIGFTDVTGLPLGYLVGGVTLVALVGFIVAERIERAGGRRLEEPQ
jgi:hypothetical protein